MRKIIEKYSGVIIALAVVVSTYSANVACSFFYHQPEQPDSVKQLRKF
ncbi:MAG: cyclic lactone autoinducer peptide [Eubacteriales bacterium]